MSSNKVLEEIIIAAADSLDAGQLQNWLLTIALPKSTTSHLDRSRALFAICAVRTSFKEMVTLEKLVYDTRQAVQAMDEFEKDFQKSQLAFSKELREPLESAFPGITQYINEAKAYLEKYEVAMQTIEDESAGWVMDEDSDNA